MPSHRLQKETKVSPEPERIEEQTVSTEPQPEAPAPSQDEPEPEQMIQVGPGLSVPLSQFRAAADPLCRYCSSGIVTRLVGKQFVRHTCECAIRNIKRQLRSQMPEKPTATVERDPAKAWARVEERLGVLRTEAATLENEIESRLRGLTDAVKEAEGDVLLARKQVQMNESRVVAARDAIEAAAMEYEARKRELESALGKEEDMSTSAVLVLEQAESKLREAKSRQSRAARDTEGARKRAENLRRRADAFEARNRGVLIGTGTEAPATVKLG